MCLAMEPATAPVDTLAQTGVWSRVLGPGERSAWQMRVAIEIV
jgi:galactose mutarotase-like enzyme